jgi:hypothetical protein
MSANTYCESNSVLDWWDAMDSNPRVIRWTEEGRGVYWEGYLTDLWVGQLICSEVYRTWPEYCLVRWSRVCFSQRLWLVSLSLTLRRSHKLRNRMVNSSRSYYSVFNITLFRIEQASISHGKQNKTKNLRGFSPQANYTDRGTAAFRRT